MKIALTTPGSTHQGDTKDMTVKQISDQILAKTDAMDQLSREISRLRRALLMEDHIK